MVTKQQVAKVLKEAREKAGMTQKKLTEEVGYCDTSGYITRVEQGFRWPSLELAFRIEKALGLTDWRISSLIIRRDLEQAGMAEKALNNSPLEGMVKTLEISSEKPAGQKLSIPLVLDVQIRIP